MKIEISMYKKSGKFYASDIVSNDEHIPLYEDRFMQFIADNLPASIDGYVVVRNADDASSDFYDSLYSTDELKNRKEEGVAIGERLKKIVAKSSEAKVKDITRISRDEYDRITEEKDLL